MRESGPFLSIFSFYLFFFFSFFCRFFLFFCFFFFLLFFLSWPPTTPATKNNAPSFTAQRTCKPKFVWDKNSCSFHNSRWREEYCFHQDLRRLFALRSFLEIGFRLSSLEVRIAYCLGTSGIGVFGWNGETAIIALIRISGIITFFSFFYWQPRELPLMILWKVIYDFLKVKADSVELSYFDKLMDVTSETVNVNIRALSRIFCKTVPA